MNVGIAIRGGFWLDIAKDWEQGLLKLDVPCRLIKSHDLDSYRLAQLKDVDVVVCFGRLGLPGAAILQACRLGQQWIYVDHAYFGRYRYIRVAVNALYWLPEGLPEPDWDRWREQKAALGIQIQPWREPGEWILLTGAGVMPPDWTWDGWLRHSIAQVAQATSRPIRYRPKPSFHVPSEEAPEGTVGDPVTDEIRVAEQALKATGRKWEVSCPARQTLAGALWDARAIVTLHSNACLDALVLGVPGVVLGQAPAKSISGTSWADLENPPRLPDPARETLFARLAGIQFTKAEIASGLPWQRLAPCLPTRSAPASTP